MYLDGRRLLAMTLVESRGNFIGLIKVLVADETRLVSKLSTTGKNYNWLLPSYYIRHHYRHLSRSFTICILNLSSPHHDERKAGERKLQNLSHLRCQCSSPLMHGVQQSERERMHASAGSRHASADVKGEKGSKLALTSVTLARLVHSCPSRQACQTAACGLISVLAAPLILLPP